MGASLCTPPSGRNAGHDEILAQSRRRQQYRSCRASDHVGRCGRIVAVLWTMMRASRRILRIFAKGNVDVRDSLLWSRVGGVLEWNGINEVIRARHPGVLAKIKHETCTRLDLI